MATADALVVRGLGAAYDGAPVLTGIDLRVPAGALAALLGPNGSGKTTLLRVLAGLEPATTGTIERDGERIDARPAHQRGFGFVFQEPALFPGRTVADNIAYGLELRHWAPAAVDARLDELLDRLRLRPLAARRAEALSGGERQRTALARALAPRPGFVLLDEPFASVDPELRLALREEFRAALRAEGVAGIHVTHDPEEALALADRLFLLRGGRLVQSGTPAEVLRAPVDAAAARFLGYELWTSGARTTAFLPRELEEAEPGPGAFAAEVEEARPAAGEWLVRLRGPSGGSLLWRPPTTQPPPARGRILSLRPRRAVEYPSQGPAPTEAGGAPAEEP